MNTEQNILKEKIKIIEDIIILIRKNPLSLPRDDMIANALEDFIKCYQLAQKETAEKVEKLREFCRYGVKLFDGEDSAETQIIAEIDKIFKEKTE